MSFLYQFYKIADFLEEQGMFINHFWVNNGASEYEIAEVENVLGYHLDTSITNFFRECNGVQLIWIHPKNQQFKKLQRYANKQKFVDYEFDFDDRFGFDGSILIEPISLIFLKDWYGNIYFERDIESQRKEEFAGNNYIEPDFSQRIKPFDMYNRYNEHAFFLDGSSNPYTIMGDDYQACYTDSYLMSFVDYLDFILYFYGSAEARKCFFLRFKGHSYPPKKLEDFMDFPQIDLSQYDTQNNKLVIPFEKKFWKS